MGRLPSVAAPFAVAVAVVVVVAVPGAYGIRVVFEKNIRRGWLGVLLWSPATGSRCRRVQESLMGA